MPEVWSRTVAASMDWHYHIDPKHGAIFEVQVKQRRHLEGTIYTDWRQVE